MWLYIYAFGVTRQNIFLINTNMRDISSGSHIVNLSSIVTDTALASARLCESVRVNSTNLTPRSGVRSSVGVRFEQLERFEHINYMVSFEKVSLSQMFYIRKMCDLL